MQHVIRFVEANGLRFAYIEEGSGPLVLCMHGFPDTAETWVDVMATLAPLGYRVVAPYMRGYHPTDVPEDDNYRVWELGRDVLGLMDSFGAEKAIVIGHDWGASAVYSAVAQAPERIDKLIALAIPPASTLKPSLANAWAIRHFVTFQRKSILKKYAKDPRRFLRDIYNRWAPTWDVPDQEFDAVVASFQKADSLRGAFHYYWTFARDQRSEESKKLIKSKIGVPTLLLGGDADILHVKNWENLDRAFTAPFEVALIEGAGHFLHREKPDAVCKKIASWLGPA